MSGFARVFYLRYHLYWNYSPPWAMGQYLTATGNAAKDLNGIRASGGMEFPSYVIVKSAFADSELGNEISNWF